MKYLISLMIVLMAQPAFAKIYRVAIIDTGFNHIYFDKQLKSKLCAVGHYDTEMMAPLVDYGENTHGGKIAFILSHRTKLPNYCIILIKMEYGLNGVKKAIKYASQIKPDILSISWSINIYRENIKNNLQKVSQNGIIFVSAMNDKNNFNNTCVDYPQCFNIKNMRVIGSMGKNGKISDFSNFGSIIHSYHLGEYTIGNGTSFAVPAAIADYLNAVGGQ